MLITFLCTSCQTSLETESRGAGAEVECPSCGAVLAMPAVEPGPGVTLGGFQILRQIGAGGMGKVYLARQLSMDRDVALKVISAQLTHDPEDIERFLNEVRLSARLDHPHVVTAYEAGNDSGFYYMAMAYVEGAPLDVQVKRTGAMAEEPALQIVRKVASALDYAWKTHGMLHRDIKPDNILLDRQGEPKLTDMGLSKTVAAVEQMTMAGTVIGTPNYMSPEQLEDISSVDFHADMYALGATLHHILTGEIPFDNSSVVKIFQRIASEKLPDPRTGNPALSAGCVDLLEIMLAQEARHRHADWAALLSDIDLVLQGRRAATARPPQGASALERRATRASTSQAHKLKTNHGHPEPKRPGLSKSAVNPARTLTRDLVTSVPQRKKMDPAALISLAVAVVLIGGGLTAYGLHSRNQRIKRAQAALLAREQVLAEKQAELKRRLSAPAAHLAGNPYDFDAAFRMLEKLRADATGTAYDEQARQELARLQRRKSEAVEQIQATVKAQAEQLFGAGEMAEEVAYLQTYDGPLAAETAADRKALAATYERSIDDLREQQAKLKDAARTVLDELTGTIACDLVHNKLESVIAYLAAIDEDLLAPIADEWNTVKERATAVTGMRRLVMDSFRDDAGKTVTVTLASGPQALLIKSVSEDAVLAEKQVAGGASLQGSFTFASLSQPEILKRLGDEQSAEKDIMRAMLACEAKAYDYARKLLRRADCPIAKAMLPEVDVLTAGTLAAGEAQQQSAAETASARDYRALLGSLSLPYSPNEMTDTLKAISSKRWGDLAAQRIQKLADAYMANHKATEFAANHLPVIQALLGQGGSRPVVLKFNREALNAALAQLKVDNPGMQAEPTVSVDGNMIVLSIAADPAVRNISALAGLPIKHLDLHGTRVADAGSLQGMPIDYLALDNCTGITSLNGLEGMPLKYLSIKNLRTISNLLPIKGLQIEELNIADVDGVSDLSPLTGMPLRTLAAYANRTLNDIAPLKGMTLTGLNIGGTNVRDLSPLEGMPLNQLSIHDTLVSDLSPLRNLPLSSLSIRGSRVTDISPVQNIPTLKRLER